VIRFFPVDSSADCFSHKSHSSSSDYIHNIGNSNLVFHGKRKKIIFYSIKTQIHPPSLIRTLAALCRAVMKSCSLVFAREPAVRMRRRAGGASESHSSLNLRLPSRIYTTRGKQTVIQPGHLHADRERDEPEGSFWQESVALHWTDPSRCRPACPLLHLHLFMPSFQRWFLWCRGQSVPDVDASKHTQIHPDTHCNTHTGCSFTEGDPSD